MSGFGGGHNTATLAISTAMCELNRGGRHYGGGFYEYTADGGKKLWSGLSRFKLRDAHVSMADAQDRLLYRQAIETLRCLDEGVLRSETEANLGSIFAIGFPAHTGGALQFIRGIGIAHFATRAAELAKRYGERFIINERALETLRQSKSLEV
jgi:3-hydroxyacyl-CoA dehydrogenase/enoyl-CoA hydratase/3-hydroxybutyryl-CoA epimerase